MADKKISALTGATTPLAGTEVLPIVQGGVTVKVAVSDLTAGRNVGMADLTTTGNTILGNASSDTLNVGNGDLIKDANGNVGIGISPAATRGKLQVYATGNQTDESGAASIGDTTVGGMRMYFGVNNTGEYVYVGSVKSGTAYKNLVLQPNGGNTSFGAGNLIQGTAAKGVDFSANTPAAGKTSTLLNWYEEGTWTGALVCGTSGTITLNGSFQTGSYTRVGRLVTVTGIFLVSSVSSPVGALYLTGLPFATNSAQYGRTAAAVFATDLAVTATGSIIGRALPSASQIELYKYAAGAISDLAGDVIAGTQFNINMSYVV